ncbi:MAG: type II toxin-antitoxin system RelB/DinJ family antitoxin [Atopobiaceae bacterium]|nr:type II toxin-antitoxin system RelB/DinJ family antitoxin [Atopobiaceae bacterium]
MAMTISMEDDLKRDFTEVCREIGLPPSTAIGIFARAVVRERAIPFPLSAVSSAERAAQTYELSVADGIRRGLAEVATGDVVSRDEARAMRAARTGA